MVKLLPSKPDVEPREGARVVGLDSEDADEYINALSSETARRMLAALHDDPATPSALADRIDTSLQNAQYHLGKLEDAGLVEIADTVYSEKGREMKVYAPADRALVVVAGGQETTSGLRAAITRLLGGVGILGVASLALQRLLEGPYLGASSSSAPPAADSGGGATATALGGGGGGGNATATAATSTPQPTAAPTTTSGGAQIAEATKTATPAPSGTATAPPTGTPTQVATETAAHTATHTATPAAQLTRTVAEGGGGGFHLGQVPELLATSPGLTFFLGGTTVLLGVFLLWWWQHR